MVVVGWYRDLELIGGVISIVFRLNQHTKTQLWLFRLIFLSLSQEPAATCRKFSAVLNDILHDVQLSTEVGYQRSF